MASAVVGSLIGSLLSKSARPPKKGKPAKSRFRASMVKPAGAVRKMRPSKVPKSFRPSKQMNRLENDGQGNEKLGASYGRPPKALSRSLEYKIRMALNPLNHSVIQQTSRCTATRGASSYTVYEIGTPADIDSCRANADGQMGLNQNGTTTLRESKNAKFFVKGCSMAMTMTNASSGLAYLRIYEYICRRSLPTSASSTNSVVQNGFGDVGGGGQVNSTSYGGSLYNNPRFCVYNKIVKVRTVQLGCGRSFQYNLSIRKPKTFNPIYDNATFNQTHAGYTRGIIVQVYGQPVNYVTGDAITSDDVKVDVIQQRKYHWSVIAFPMNGNFLSTNISTDAGQLELIDATGDKQNDIQA